MEVRDRLCLLYSCFSDVTLQSSSTNEPTDFGKTVTRALAAMSQNGGAIDQRLLRYYLTMSASFLVTDTTMNPEGGLNTWSSGFLQLANVLVALHRRTELELETVNEISKACSECWTVCGSWRGLEAGRDTVREVAGKVKTLLDANGRTFQGQPIYAPGS